MWPRRLSCNWRYSPTILTSCPYDPTTGDWAATDDRWLGKRAWLLLWYSTPYKYIVYINLTQILGCIKYKPYLNLAWTHSWPRSFKAKLLIPESLYYYFLTNMVSIAKKSVEFSSVQFILVQLQLFKVQPQAAHVKSALVFRVLKTSRHLRSIARPWLSREYY